MKPKDPLFFQHYLAAWKFARTLGVKRPNIHKLDLHTWVLELPCNKARAS